MVDTMVWGATAALVLCSTWAGCKWEGAAGTEEQQYLLQTGGGELGASTGVIGSQP